MKIEKSECNYQVTECDLKFGEQITLDGEPLIPVSVLWKIRAEIKRMFPLAGKWMYDEEYEHEHSVCEILADVVLIIDKYIEESRVTEE